MNSLSKIVILFLGISSFTITTFAADTTDQPQTYEFTYTLPDADPAPESPVNLVEATRNQHPRLLFTSQDIPVLQERIQGPGKQDFDKLLSYLPVSRPEDEPNWLHNSTNGQQQGFWRMPTVGLHYVLAGNQTSFNRAKGYLELLLSLERWEEGREPDSGMGHGNILAGASLLYDWLYNDLPEDFRNKFRQKLLLQARRQYYGGHLKGNTLTAHYWQNDPQNNHRWHRNAGFVLAAIALADDNTTDEDWILTKAYEEMKFIVDWLPDDGTTHESPSYMVFGAAHLFLAVQACDINFGTQYLNKPFFSNIVNYRVYTMTPGFTRVFGYGDSGEKAFGSYANYHFKAAELSGNPDFYDAIYRYRETHEGAFWIGWFDVLWNDPTIKRGNIQNLALYHFFPDIGFLSVRDGWNAHNVAMTFKSSPLGGHLLNMYRNERNFHPVNVAHDDPDANSFMIYLGGEIVAKTDGYSYDKISASQNTILVDGRGQRGEGGLWSQPIPNYDMTQMANIVSCKTLDNGVIITEGDATGAYPSLTRYRRTMIWVPGCYILMLDDIRADTPRKITSLIQSEQAQILDPEQGLYKLTAGNASLPLQAVANQPLTPAVVDSPAQARKQLLGYKQLQLTAISKHLTIATIFNPWNRKNLSVTLTHNPDNYTITATDGNLTDTWQWQQAPNNHTPATLTASRIAQPFATLTADDKLPEP